MYPAVILGGDSSKKIAFQLSDVNEINKLIMRLKMFKSAVVEIEELKLKKQLYDLPADD